MVVVKNDVQTVTCSILPNIYSGDTVTSRGDCKTGDFNNKLFSIKQGKKQVKCTLKLVVDSNTTVMLQIIQTGEQEFPWLQMDLGSFYDVVEVCQSLSDNY